MITCLFSAALRGVEAQEVEVGVNARGADKQVRTGDTRAVKVVVLTVVGMPAKMPFPANSSPAGGVPAVIDQV